MADKEPFSADDIKRRKRKVYNNEPNEMNFHADTLEGLDDLLKELLEAIPEVKAAAIVSAEGLPIASALPQGVDDTKFAAMTAAMLSLSETTLSEMVTGDFDQLYIKGSSGYLLVKKAGPNSVLMLSTTSEVRLGYSLDILLGNIFRKRRGDNFSAPYIGVPPSPPGVLGIASQVQIHASQKLKDQWDNPFCKHCGAFLPEGQSICPNCGKKVI